MEGGPTQDWVSSPRHEIPFVQLPVLPGQRDDLVPGGNKVHDLNLTGRGVPLPGQDTARQVPDPKHSVGAAGGEQAPVRGKLMEIILVRVDRADFQDRFLLLEMGPGPLVHPP